MRKSLFALRACLAAAVADRRLALNPAQDVPLPVERADEQRFLTREEVDALLDAVPEPYRVVVVLGALCGLRWGEIVGLRRGRVDTLRRRLSVVETVSEVGGEFVHGEPKTAKSRRVIPVGRAVMAELERHLSQFVEPGADALVVTTSNGRTPGRSAFGSAT